MDDEPQTQGPRSSEGKPEKNLAAKAGDFVAAHRMMVVAVIVLLVAAVIYLYATQAGWFGLGAGKSRLRSRKSGAAAREDEDPETDRLIDSINAAAGQ